MEYFAKKRTRALEAVIDYAIFYTAFFLYLFTFGQPDKDGNMAVEGIQALPLVGLWLVYFPIIEGTTGQTLGKKIVGIRVVRVSGSEIHFWDSFVRRLFDSVDMLFLGLVGILVMRNSEKSQRVGDLIAKTIVIEDNPSVCDKCGEQLTLSRHEFFKGEFVCPKCGALCKVKGRLY